MKPMNRSAMDQRGLSLIEVMVAMVIGLILMAGVGYVYLSGKRSYNVQQAAATVQENGRFAMDFMRPEIRMAGYFGCGAGSQHIANDLNNPTAIPWYEDIQTPLVGYEGGVSTFPTGLSPTPLANTDAITILRGNSDDQYMITHQQTGKQASFTLNKVSDLAVGSIVVVSDCTDTAIFQMTGPTGSTSSSEVVHNTGNKVSPGNCTSLMGTQGGASADCTAPANFGPHTFQGSGSLMALRAATFYVAAVPGSSPQETALYEAVLGNTGTVGTSKELVDGVENMQILYGVAPAVREAPVQYVTANNVTNWGDVVEVRISLLVRSSDPVLPTPVSTSFGGQTYDDKYLRRIFDASIAIRNRDAE